MTRRIRWGVSFALVGLLIAGISSVPAFESTAVAVPPSPRVGQATANVGWFEQSKYGLFVTYTTGLTVRADGSMPTTVEQLASEFNANQFAADVDSFGVDYVMFSAWHKAMQPLYPSAVMDSWRSGQSASRDLIREIITALQPYGIRLVLYIHATDGHDFSPSDQNATGWNDSSNGYQRWNDFVNATITELGQRYGTDVEGMWVDMIFDTFQQRIDRSRLRTSLLAGNPERVLLGNTGYDRTEDATLGAPAIDYPAFEHPGPENPSRANVMVWPTSPNQAVGVVSSNWWASRAEGPNVVASTPENLYRYLVLQAGANQRGGGTAYAAGVYAGSTGTIWETGVRGTMQNVGSYVQAAGDSLRNTRPSAAYPSSAGTTLGTTPSGWVGLSSQDGAKTFIHVLNSPAGATITLPAPADGTRFTGAVNRATGRSVRVDQTTTSVGLTLTGGDAWSAIDTIIELTNAAPAYGSLRNNDTPLTFSGSWGRSTNRNAGDYLDDVEYATSNGAYFEYAFTGSEVTYIAPRSPQYGEVDIFIDGRYFGRFSAHAQAYTPQQAIFTTAALVPGAHTLRAVKVSGDYVTIDGFNPPRINDTSPSITYSGSWGVSSFRNAGDNENDVHYTTSNGDSFQYAFNGSSVQYIAPRSPDYGDFQVYIDDVSQGVFSSHATTYLPQQVLFAVNTLGSGMHVIKVVKVSGSYITIDAMLAQ